VRNVQPFGFFVDIGGVDGLVPRREISWTNADPTSAVAVGQSVEVAVLEIDRDAKRLTLSARALEDDPWTSVVGQFREGGVYPGTVVKLETFGAFVELAPGVTGLAHVSKLAAGTPERGSTLNVRVLSIDREQRRIALAPAVEGETVTAPDEPAAGVVAEVLRNGVVVQLDDGRTGWLAATEVELEPGTVLAQRFRRGRRLEARVVSDEGNRVTLSMRADPAVDRQAWSAHQSAGGGSSSGFGTLADLLGGVKVDR
jgi:small subunit ribosomal protein S1